ncbi:MAG: hypothetical protein H0V94_05130 [Actinobacteria bacterium]|nr:hypothetical protein [Actinomycetota bacterium]
MESRPAEGLLRRPVRFRGVRQNGIKLGETVDLVLDPTCSRVLGFDVLCGDGARRFLPFRAVRIDDGDIVVGSSFALLDRDDRAFYGLYGRSFLAVTELRDVLVASGGDLLEARAGADRC